MQQSGHPIMRQIGTLAERGWLADQPVDFLIRMASAGRFKTYAAGQSLYAVGDPPDALYGLETGMLNVALPIQDDEVVTVHRAGPGIWLGESAMLAETTRSLSVTAAVECRVFRIPAAAIRRDLQDFPGDWQSFYLLSHLNGTLAARILAEVLSLSPRARFARMLLRLADANGAVRVTQQDLAELAGMNRATFRRAFAELIAAGVVQTEYGGLQILDRAALDAEVQRG